MRKLIFTLMIIALLACPAMAQRYRQMQIAIVDEFGQAVTNIDQIEIYDAGTDTASTIYSTRAGVSRTNPMTTTSGGFDQSLGLASWFQSAPDFKITVVESGESQSLTVDNLTSTDVRFAWYVNYIGEAATLQITDDTTLDFGTSDNFYFDWVAGSTKLILAPAADDARWDIGIADYATDIYWITGASIATDYALFDQDEAEIYLCDIDVMWDDEAIAIFGSDEDFSIYSSSANVLVFDPGTTANTINFGTANTDAVDIKWFTDTSANFVTFNEGDDEVYFTDVDIQMDDDADIIFGTQNDFVIESDSTAVLEILGSGSSEDHAVNLGLASSGVDLKAFGTDAGDYWEWDSSADLVTIVGDAVAWTLTEAATTAVNIDITGTDGGFDLDTTDGPIALTTAGGVLGDMTLTVSDDYANTVSGHYALAVTGSATITTTSDTASAIYIRENAGTSGTIKIHADQGEGDESIYLDSDAGGITIKADGGSIDIEPTGGSDGDLGITVGDDMTVIVSGDYSLAVTGTTTLDEILFKCHVEVVTTTSTTVHAVDTGTVFVTTSGTGSQTFSLPTAAAGLVFTFVDISATANDDVKILASSGDTINGGTANRWYWNTADAIPGSATLMAVDTAAWVVITSIGTWANNNDP